MTKDLEIIKLDDQYVCTAADIKDIPFFQGKVVLNTNAAWKRNWDRHSVWISPCGNKVSNLTKEQYDQLANAGVPVKNRPSRTEVDKVAQSLVELSDHPEILRYLHEKHGIRIDVEEDEDEEDAPTNKTGKTDGTGKTVKVGSMRITRRGMDHFGNVEYSIVTPITNGKKVLIYFNTRIEQTDYPFITNFKISTKDNQTHSFIETDAVTLKRIPFYEIKDVLDLDNNDIQAITAGLMRITNNDQHEMFPESLQIWKEISRTIGGAQYLCMQI